jgi:hypothetical protein
MIAFGISASHFSWKVLEDIFPRSSLVKTYEEGSPHTPVEISAAIYMKLPQIQRLPWFLILLTHKISARECTNIIYLKK